MPLSEVTPVTYLVQPPTPPCLPKGHSHGHEWLIHIPFIPCQSAFPLMRLHYFKLWPWKFKAKFKAMSKVKGQGHTVNPVSNWFAFFSAYINQTLNSWHTAISKFDLEISKVKVMGEFKGQSHIVDELSNQCPSVSFHINLTHHS